MNKVHQTESKAILIAYSSPSWSLSPSSKPPSLVSRALRVREVHGESVPHP